MGGRDVGWVGFLFGWMDGWMYSQRLATSSIQLTSSHGGSGWIEAVVS